MAVDDLLEQAKKMREKQQRELSAMRSKGGAAGVDAKMDGHRHLLSIKIDPNLLEGDDLSELEQRVMSAINQATSKMDAILERKFGPSSGIPDLF